MRPSVVVEDISDGDAPCRHRDAIDVALAGQLILSILDSFLLAAETKSLAEEIALRAEFGKVVTGLLRLAIGKARQPEGVPEPKTLLRSSTMFGMATIAVGCGHVSGLLVQPFSRLLALMWFARWVLIS